MLIDSLGSLYRKVISVQAILGATVVLIAILSEGNLAALSASVGALSVVAGSLAYAILARKSKVTAVSAGTLVSRHALAEVAKWVVVLGIIFAAMSSGWFAATWLVAAMCVALMGHWLVFLIIR